MPTAVVLDGHSLTLDDVVAARWGARRSSSHPPRGCGWQANAVVAALVESGAVAYGVTTGFEAVGDRASRRRDWASCRTWCEATPPASAHAARARDARDDALRANVIAKAIGARAVLADTLVAMLNAGLIRHPRAGGRCERRPRAARASRAVAHRRGRPRAVRNPGKRRRCSRARDSLP